MLGTMQGIHTKNLHKTKMIKNMVICYIFTLSMEENKTHTKSIAAIVLVLFAVLLSPLVENGPSCDCGNPPCLPEL